MKSDKSSIFIAQITSDVIHTKVEEMQPHITVKTLEYTRNEVFFTYYVLFNILVAEV
ncbi:MAG: hypothetical protein MUE81_02660 [Thermoflexibacter sp.]|jgi:hypothetical protein|nr:hypothetical protein [Thermoflexibacter sp.]